MKSKILWFLALCAFSTLMSAIMGFDRKLDQVTALPKGYEHLEWLYWMVAPFYSASVVTLCSIGEEGDAFKGILGGILAPFGGLGFTCFLAFLLGAANSIEPLSKKEFVFDPVSNFILTISMLEIGNLIITLIYIAKTSLRSGLIAFAFSGPFIFIFMQSPNTNAYKSLLLITLVHIICFVIVTILAFPTAFMCRPRKLWGESRSFSDIF